MAVSELPGNPNAVWTVRRHIEGASSFYLIFMNTSTSCKLFSLLPHYSPLLQYLFAVIAYDMVVKWHCFILILSSLML